MGINNPIPASRHEIDLSLVAATVIRTDHGQPAPNTKLDAMKRAIDLSQSGLASFAGARDVRRVASGSNHLARSGDLYAGPGRPMGQEFSHHQAPNDDA